MLPRETIARFDSFLHERGLGLEAVVVGGAALGLLGVTDRQTRDVDVLQPAFSGTALTLRALGRTDLLKTKLFALCDRGTDLPDCVALEPTADELAEAQAWVALQDANPGWPDHVQRALDDLRGRLGHGL